MFAFFGFDNVSSVEMQVDCEVNRAWVELDIGNDFIGIKENVEFSSVFD